MRVAFGCFRDRSTGGKCEKEKKEVPSVGFVFVGGSSNDTMPNMIIASSKKNFTHGRDGNLQKRFEGVGLTGAKNG